MAKKQKLKEFHKNPRKISQYELSVLKKNIEDLGDLSGITIDITTNEIITGNQRSKVLDIEKCEQVVLETLEAPDKQGTVEYGYFLSADGTKMNYRKVKWDDKQRDKANITANKLGGEWDWEVLNSEKWDKDVLIDSGFESLDFEGKDNFTPNYNPKKGDNEVSQEDMDKKKEELENKSKINTQTNRTILCPHCLKEFEIENK